jgi:hypothetical protein
VDVVRSRELTFDAGGVAFAGARGIEKVEVRIDDGDWKEAELRRPLSDLSWVVWRATLTSTAGEHLITVRTADGGGHVQSVPLHSRRIKI